MRPTIGRIVIFTSLRGAVFPAIITRVNADGTIALTSFPPASSDGEVIAIVLGIPSARLDEYASTTTGIPEPGCWCWPPRVPT